MEKEALVGIYMERDNISLVHHNEVLTVASLGGGGGVNEDLSDTNSSASACTLGQYPGWLAASSLQKVFISVLGALGQYKC